MPKSERSVQILDRKYCLKSEPYGSNVRISALLAFLCYECQNPNDRMNRTIRNPNKSVRTIDCSDFSIVWISDVRISAFHCTTYSECLNTERLKSKLLYAEIGTEGDSEFRQFEFQTSGSSTRVPISDT